MNKASYNKITINGKNIIINSNQTIVINNLGTAEIVDNNKVILTFNIYKNLNEELPLYSSFLVKTGNSITSFKKDFGKKLMKDKDNTGKNLLRAAQFLLEMYPDSRIDRINDIKSTIELTEDFVVYVSTTNPTFIFSIYYYGHIYIINK